MGDAADLPIAGPPPPPPTDAQLRDAAVAELKLTTVGYLNHKWQPPPPDGTHWKGALDLLARIGVAPAPPAPPAPPAWTVAPPRPPITSATNDTGVGLLVNGGPGQFRDYTSAGTFDSAVLLGPECAGTTFQRFRLEQAASVGQGPGYGRHGLYCKAANVSCSDWFVRMDPAAPDIGSGWSVRYAGFSLERFDFAGLWFASLFDDDPAHAPGPATFRDGRAAFASSAAILVDAQLAYAVTLTGIDFTGPTGIVLHVDQGSVQPTVVCTGCTINGAPVAAAAFEGVPAASLTVRP
jgi:hypothetical protein